MSVLQFIFQDFLHFIGTIILIEAVAAGLAMIASQIRSKR